MQADRARKLLGEIRSTGASAAAFAEHHICDGAAAVLFTFASMCTAERSMAPPVEADQDAHALVLRVWST